MAKTSVLSNVITLIVWLTGILVSLAVGFGMIDGKLTVWNIPTIITVYAGWIVVILTIVGVVLKIIERI